MSAYDNPRIIQDLYGSMAWAKAAEKLSGTLVKSVENMNAVRIAGFEAAKKKRETLALTANKIALAKSLALEGNITKFRGENPDLDPSLVEQYQEIGTNYMKGIDGEFEGSIKSETDLFSISYLTPREEEEKRNRIKMSQRFQTNMIQWAARMKDNLTLVGDMNIPILDGYGWRGDTPQEQLITQWSANFMDGKGVEGVTSKKTIIPNYITGENKLKVTHKIKGDDDILGDYFTDEEKYPRDKDGYITVEFNKDINKWDGKFLFKKFNLDLKDYQVEAGVKNNKNEINPHLTSKPIMRINSAADEIYTDRFINIPAINFHFENTASIQDKIGGLMGADTYIQKDFYTDTLKINDVMDDSFFTQDVDVQEKFWMNALIEQWRRNQGINTLENGERDPGNKPIPGEDIIYREITEDDAAIINANKEEGAPEIKWGKDQMGYFLRDTRTARAPGSTTNLAVHLEIQRKAMLTPNPGKGYAIYSSNNKMRIINIGSAQNPIWEQEYLVNVSQSIKGGDDPDLGATNVKAQKWQKLPKANDSYIIPGKNRELFRNYLQI